MAANVVVSLIDNVRFIQGRTRPIPHAEKRVMHDENVRLGAIREAAQAGMDRLA